ncbi:MAG: Carnitine transport permease protein OpuCD [Cellulomonadaceae bacterium TMED98]|nr:MAG: Carnitine transport permease protein OpuCD [Cellulomonadaceae bacterium TMED98]
MTAIAPTQRLKTPLSERLDLIVTPVFAALLALMGVVVWLYSDIDEVTQEILAPEKIARQINQTITLGVLSSLLVVVIAVPIGIIVSRRGFPRLKTFLVDFLGLAQALPAYGLIVIFFTFMGTGITTVVYALALFSLLPVLRNTIVGLEQVDKSVIDAGRGMGYTRLQVLLQIELPLAVPVIMAGIRTAIVINVGMAALAFLVGGGGIGETINSGLKLNRAPAIFLGAVMVAILAMVFDFLSALAQKYLKPKGI